VANVSQILLTDKTHIYITDSYRLATECQLSSEEGCRQPALCRLKDLCHQVVSNFRDQCFVAAGPLKAVEQLPAGLKQTDISYEQFKQLIKTYLFQL